MSEIQTDIVVIGAGPGGYAAAFGAAERGKKVVLVEKEDRLGGVCLNDGCIPSKALLHATKVMREAKESEIRGITYGDPKVDLKQLRAWKDSVLETLGKGIRQTAKTKKVEIVQGCAQFESSNSLRIQTSGGSQSIPFQKAVIATGSKPALPKAFDLGSERIMTSTEALRLGQIPKKLLVIGGGYIGLELGTVYATLGSQITLVEALSSLLPGVDADLVRPVAKFAKENFRDVRLKTKVLGMKEKGAQIEVAFETQGKKASAAFDRVLAAVGRVPNSAKLGLEKTKVKLDRNGFIQVNDRQQTADPSIYAIGDVAGGALFAHKAHHEARRAVEAMLGKGEKKKLVVPAVVFTDPEVAWCGLTETEAQAQKMDIKIAKFLWGGSGRAVTMDRPYGLTKLLIDPKTEQILGVGLVGTGAGELIAEGALALQKGATVHDLARTIHPHPTLSETLMAAAESFYV